METLVMILDCPAYMDADGRERCGLPAAVEYRYTVESTDGPLESAKIRCPRGHWFNGPIESLTWDEHQAVTARAATEANRNTDVRSSSARSGQWSPRLYKNTK